MVNTVRETNLLKRLIHNWKEPTAFAGSVKLLLQRAKAEGYKKGIQGIREFLEGQKEQTLTAYRRTTYPVQSYRCFTNFQLWESDLISLLDIAQFNNGMKYILVTVSCLTRKIYLRPLKNKTAQETVAAMGSVIKEAGGKPRYWKFDRGGEFVNKTVKDFFNKEGISLRVSQHINKANLSEIGVRRTMKRLSRYFIFKNTYHYVNILPELAQALNDTPLVSLSGLTPNKATEMVNKERTFGFDIWSDRIKKQERKNKKPDFKRVLNKQKRFREKDWVRVSLQPDKMSKSYAHTYSTPLYQIDTVIRDGTVPMYVLKDMKDRLVEGAFYPDELVKVTAPSKKQAFEIEKILGRRVDKASGEKQILVRFKGYGKEFDEYVPESAVVDI